MATFQTFVRVKGTTEWKAVTHSDYAFYADDQSVGPMQQMAAIMAANFPLNEYSIMEVTL